MGSCEFVHTHTCDNPEAAFKEIRDQAVCEFGTDPYSGTIAAADCGLIVLNPDGLMTEAAALDLMDKTLNESDKWDPVKCIRVGAATKTRSRTVTKTLTFDRLPYTLCPREVARKLGLPSAASVEVIEQGSFETTNKIVKTRTAGASRKRWGLIVNGQVVEMFGNKTDAKAALAALFTEVPEKVTSPSPSQIRKAATIRPMVEDPAEESWSVEQTFKVKVKAKVTEPEADSPLVFDHLLFFGWAPS